jgi:hypothetical protein
MLMPVQSEINREIGELVYFSRFVEASANNEKALESSAHAAFRLVASFKKQDQRFSANNNNNNKLLNRMRLKMA